MTPGVERTAGVPPGAAPEVGAAGPGTSTQPPRGVPGPQTPALAPCGTNAAYERHRRHGLRGDQIDPACRAAHTARNVAYAEKVRAKGRTLPPCTACGGKRTPYRGAYGWCDACHTRWLRAGRPTGGPPPSRIRESTARREEFTFLREQGEAVEQAARRVGIAPRTGENWEYKRLAGAL